MEDKIKQVRQAAFEAWDTKTFGSADADHSINDDDGSYFDGIVDQCWRAFNAALDCVVIELPPELHAYSGQPQDERLLDADRNHTIKQCRAAIESTNLGIKIK